MKPDLQSTQDMGTGRRLPPARLVSWGAIAPVIAGLFFGVMIMTSWGFTAGCAVLDRERPEHARQEPMNVVSIINFVRGSEPRDRTLDLVRPVREQLALADQYDLPATFLLMYNAWNRSDIAELLSGANEHIEIGVWLEMDKTLVEAAGLPWRGRPGYDWDWHADVGFLIGYTPEQRRKIIDTAMDDFHNQFGFWPNVVGAWILDAPSLSYLESTYGVQAAAMCRDQWGTDGYSLWGGYFSGAFYPARSNIFRPADSEEPQIPVPVFRMLGTDPMHQFDAGLAGPAWEPLDHQPVLTLEPVWQLGQRRDWITWFFDENFRNDVLSLGFAQVGQENSFGWDQMASGLRQQFEIVAEREQLGQIQVLTLGEAGTAYRERFERTPPQATVALTDWRTDKGGTVWYNSHAYRANLFWDSDSVFFRDIRVFMPNVPQPYLSEPNEHAWMRYENPALVDGYLWSGNGTRAGLYFVNAVSNTRLAIESVHSYGSTTPDIQTVLVEFSNDLTLQIDLFPEYLSIMEVRGALQWAVKLERTEGPRFFVGDTAIEWEHEGHTASVHIGDAHIEETADGFRLVPRERIVRIGFR